ncbi:MULTISPECIES: hypothetical protein [Methylosinus]|nr:MULTISPECIES: hypothetical protein [Methylosinus]
MTSRLIHALFVLIVVAGAAIADTNWYNRFKVGAGLSMSSGGVLSSSGGGGGVAFTYATKAALVAAIAGGANPEKATVDAVATPGAGYGTCGLTYAFAETTAGLYGEIAAGGGFMIPQYSNSPVKACEFGVVGDAYFQYAGDVGAVTSTGGASISVSGVPYFRAGMQCASPHWHSRGGVTSIVTATTDLTSGHISVSPSIPSGSYKLACWFPMSSATGTDNWAALQAAIDYALYKTASTVVVPDGAFVVSKGLNVGYGANGFQSISLEGQQAPLVGLAGTKIFCRDTTRPCVNFQGTRSSRLRRIALYGANYGFGSFGATFNIGPSPDPLDYIDPSLAVTGSTPGGLQTNSPLVGVCVDCYSGDAPSAPYGAVTYPSLLFGTAPSQYGKNYSSDVHVEDCQIFGFGIQAAVGLNTNTQGDFFGVDRTNMGAGAYGLGAFNTQSRNVRGVAQQFLGVHSAYVGTALGEGTGQWDGVFDSPSASTIYQWVNFTNTAYAGGLILTQSYCEVCVRLGDWIGTSTWNSSLVFDGGTFQNGEAFSNLIPGSYLTVGHRAAVEFRGGFLLTGNSRIVTLVNSPGGDVHDLILNDVYLRGAFYYTGGDSAVAIAANYTGGMPIGAPLFSGPPKRYLTSGAVIGAKCVTSGASCVDSQLMHADLDVTTRASLTQFTTGFVDVAGRQWKFDLPVLQVQPYTSSAFTTGGAPNYTSCDVITFTIKAANYAQSRLHIAPGWQVMDRDTGTDWVVTAVTIDGSGNAVATAQQQNSLDFNDGCASTYGFSSAAFFTFIPAPPTIGAQVEYGDFTAGSATVANVSRGDGDNYGGDISSWLAVGDTISGPLRYESSRPWPIGAGKQVTITDIVNGSSGGTVTLSAPADYSGRFPLLPYPAH